MNNKIETEPQSNPDLQERAIIKTSTSQINLKVALTGIMTALVAVSTSLISINLPISRGYFNIGDGMIFVSALLFGPYIGGIASGVGSCLADIFLGYPMYAPVTLIVKGLEGLIVGLTYKRLRKRSLGVENLGFKVIAILAGSPFMVGGYFAAESLFFGGVSVAVFEIVPNMLQIAFGMVLALIINSILEFSPMIISINEMLVPLPQV